jgi:hypothetical protein
MARSWFTVGKGALILGIFIAIPIARFHGQNKPQVAPAAKSDSIDIDENGNNVRVQEREIPGTNFRIAGVDLAASEDLFDQVTRILGKTEDEASNDDDFRDEVCYSSAAPHDTTHLSFGQGNVEQFFVLSSDDSAWAWKIPCRPSVKITRDLATSSGLHLGQTQEQVIAILGLPTSHDRNMKSGMDEMSYDLKTEKKLSPQELAPYLQDELKHNPKVDQSAWIKNNGFYSLWISVDASFRNDHLISLRILWSET